MGDAFLAIFGWPSSAVFGLPWAREGGRKGSDGSLLAVLVGIRILGLSLLFSSSSSPSVKAVFTVDGAACRTLKANPGPFPPPKTRSCGGAAVVFCWGAGSMVNNEEAPAPVLCRFAAGRSDSMPSCSSLSSLRSAGSPIVIFFDGRFVVLGGGSGMFDVDSGFKDFALAGWVFVGRSLSFSLPLPLPLSLP